MKNLKKPRGKNWKKPRRKLEKTTGLRNDVKIAKNHGKKLEKTTGKGIQRHHCTFYSPWFFLIFINPGPSEIGKIVVLHLRN